MYLAYGLHNKYIPDPIKTAVAYHVLFYHIVSLGGIRRDFHNFLSR